MERDDIIARMELLRNEIAKLAEQLPDDPKQIERGTIGYLKNDIHKLWGRFAQIATYPANWQGIARELNVTIKFAPKPPEQKNVW